MRNTLIICRKELRSYFVSPIAYLLLTAFAAIFALFFWSFVRGFSMESTASMMRGQQLPMNLNDDLIRPLIMNTVVITFFLIPMISMRIFAEEKRTGTIELLATSPLRDLEIVIGKWMASTLLYCGMLFIAVLNLLWLFKYGNPDWKPVAIGFLGLLLQGSASIALGMFISTLTRNQIIAGAVTFIVLLALYILRWIGAYDTGTWPTVANYLSTSGHLESFAKGVLSIKDAVFYVSMILAGLFLTSRSLESLRWRA